MNQHRAIGFDASIAALAKDNPGLALSRVPSSITSYFGQSLGWPEWLLDGTDLAGLQKVPRDMRLIDGLKVLANLLDRYGEARLMQVMLEWPRFPSEAEALAAPDLHTALRTLIPKVDERNPTVEMTLVEQGETCSITISTNRDLESFCAIYEQMALTWLFLVARSFLGMSQDGNALLARIAIGRLHSDLAVDAILPCQAIETDGSAIFVIPHEALSYAGPEFKAELWQGVLASLALTDGPDLPHSASIPDLIENLVSRSLRDHGLAPSFEETARLCGRSERALARALNGRGTSYRDIVNRLRMDMAMAMLIEGDASVRQISAKLGYSDDTAFVRAFRRHFGLSPTNWRKAATR